MPCPTCGHEYTWFAGWAGAPCPDRWHWKGTVPLADVAWGPKDHRWIRMWTGQRGSGRDITSRARLWGVSIGMRFVGLIVSDKHAA